MKENLSILDINDYYEKNIIDIRDTDLYNKGHVTNAMNIPFLKLILNPEKYLNRNIRYYIYCQKGFESRTATLELLRKGYNVVNLYGGYELYKKHK